MPDINGPGPSRDSNDIYTHRDEPDPVAAGTQKAADEAAARAQPRPAPAPESLPQKPAKLDPRAFANPALTGQSAKRPATTEEMCKLAKGPDGQISEERLGSCVEDGGKCLAPAEAKQIAEACAAAAKEETQTMAAAIPTPRGTVLEEQFAKNMAEQLAIQQSVRSDPLAAVAALALISTGGSRDQVYAATQSADVVFDVAGTAAGGYAGAVSHQTRIVPPYNPPGALPRRH